MSAGLQHGMYTCGVVCKHLPCPSHTHCFEHFLCEAHHCDRMMHGCWGITARGDNRKALFVPSHQTTRYNIAVCKHRQQKQARCASRRHGPYWQGGLLEKCIGVSMLCSANLPPTVSTLYTPQSSACMHGGTRKRSQVHGCHTRKASCTTAHACFAC